ncbi:orotidine-5'-phosphate decarboxylase [Marinicrinis lubricantis]|uniref:Orotidine 5'-phosphate decarboxylase n=1 Tax=Marinicrinis lubricantis TaxID=2086470 RepID=A0ABW1ISC1_9BACL
MSQWMQSAGKVMVALDYPEADQAKALLQELAGIPCYIKVGMQLFYNAGPAFIEQLKSQGYKVFLDLKMHDIPNTVKGGAASITRLGVDMFNVHAAGGRQMMEAALEGLQQALAPNQTKPLVIAVTQLTSTSEQVLNQEIGIPGTMIDAVVRYAGLTKESGLDGVVASSLEVQHIKQHCGPQFITVTPGIRPSGVAAGDQSRVMTPKQAMEAGTDFIVVGRPITGAERPREALEHILKEMNGE